MKRLAFAAMLAFGLLGSFSAQPIGPSVTTLADTIDVDRAHGRTVFTGDVVIVVDGTEISTKGEAVYDSATNVIDLANGTVRIALAGKPSALKLSGRRTISTR